MKLEREKAELEWQKHQLQLAEWKRKEEEKRHLKAIQDSREQLEAVIQTWAKVNSVRAFFADIEKSAQRLDGVAREAVMERLANAKELIGDLDALKHFADWKPPPLQGGE
ncbi:GTP1/Obg family GTP-binding protein [Pseudomonas sp. PvR086]